MIKPAVDTKKFLIFANIFLLLCAVAFFVVLFGNKLFRKAPYCKDCNVIFVSIDTLSANHLPCYGYKRNTSPNLCKFADKNIIFENMFANAHFTLPSHTTMFTGVFPSTHKVNRAYIDKLDKKIPFLPEILQQNGYYTYFQMPLYDTHLPIDKVYNRGIDEIEEPNKTGNFWEKGYARFTENLRAGKKTMLFLHSYYVHSPYFLKSSPIYAKKTFSNIPVNKEQFDKCTEPFVDFSLKTIKTHLDKGLWYERTKEYESLYKMLKNSSNQIQICQNLNYQHLFLPLRYSYFFNRDNISSPEMVDYIRDLYDQKIVELDLSLQYLFDFVNQKGIRENTILIITADHGEEFMEHNELQHQTLYDSNLRVPLIIYAPGAGRREITSLAQSADLVPTILDMLQIEYSYPFDGVSLVGQILGQTRKTPHIIAERAYDQIKVIRDSTYKLFIKKDKKNYVPYELYDTQIDPQEQNNIIFGYPDIARKLQKELVKLLSK